ncbi:hypothetical protein [Paracoccus sp. (in: a-proteobacteria)]|uniref:hypothetical protein n=1 Tax=Paracoccus sp. TaxID=267 RepID=UPI0026DF4DCD|nr:hypothetical protein [Paracoccus sp. (in: a-proteobacteria)]MDO5369488.1 hypothetical protein [Paracoccus sp. (in: a-proteobacteria)]
MTEARGGVQQAGDRAREWITAQRDRLRNWIDANRGPTIAWMGTCLLAVVIQGRAGLPAWAGWPLSAVIFAVPALIVLRWVRTIPRFWPDAGNRAWLGLLILTAMGQVWTAMAGAETLNLAFHEAPGLFPVALTVAALLSLPAAVAFAGAVVVMILVFAYLVVDLLTGFLQRHRWKKLPQRMGWAVMLSILPGLLLAPAFVYAFKGPDLIRRIALAADFHRGFHCSATAGPKHSRRTGSASRSSGTSRCWPMTPPRIA